MTDWLIVMLVLAVILLAVAVDLATRGPDRRAAKRLRKKFRDKRLTVSPSIPVIRAMPRRKEKR
jgi:hypothetical protein